MKFGTWLENRIFEIDYSEAVEISPELVQQAMVGKAPSDFWEKINEMLVGFLRSKILVYGLNVHDIQDIAQEAMINMMRSLHTLREIGKFKTFVLTIVNNVAKNWMRARSHMRKSLGGSDPQSLSGGNDDTPSGGVGGGYEDPQAQEPHQGMMDREQDAKTKADLKWLISQLPEDQADMIRDHYFHKLSYIDMFKSGKYTSKNGDQMPLGTIKRKLNQARETLRSDLADPYESTVLETDGFDWKTDLMLRITLSP